MAESNDRQSTAHILVLERDDKPKRELNSYWKARLTVRNNEGEQCVPSLAGHFNPEKMTFDKRLRSVVGASRDSTEC